MRTLAPGFVRNLRNLRSVRSACQALAACGATFALVLGAGVGLPSYAQSLEQAAEASAHPPQVLHVAADASAPTVTRDGYSAVLPPQLRWPVAAYTSIASNFGGRASPCAGCSSNHQGVDFDAGNGAAVTAIAPGVVVETNNPSYSGLGVHAVIEHVIDGEHVTSVYGHLQHGSLQVRVGEAVVVGQPIGLVGSTGASTGPHLHFEIRVGGTAAVNPVAWLAARI